MRALHYHEQGVLLLYALYECDCPSFPVFHAPLSLPSTALSRSLLLSYCSTLTRVLATACSTSDTSQALALLDSLSPPLSLVLSLLRSCAPCLALVLQPACLPALRSHDSSTGSGAPSILFPALTGR